jgi:hypothetical protein
MAIKQVEDGLGEDEGGRDLFVSHGSLGNKETFILLTGGVRRHTSQPTCHPSSVIRHDGLYRVAHHTEGVSAYFRTT